MLFAALQSGWICWERFRSSEWGWSVSLEIPLNSWLFRFWHPQVSQQQHVTLKIKLHPWKFILFLLFVQLLCGFTVFHVKNWKMKLILCLILDTGLVGLMWGNWSRHLIRYLLCSNWSPLCQIYIPSEAVLFLPEAQVYLSSQGTGHKMCCCAPT